MLSAFILVAVMQEPESEAVPEAGPTLDDVRVAGELIGLEFSAEELKLMLRDVRGQLATYERLREPSLDNGVFPALTFSPLLPGIEVRLPRGTEAWIEDPGESPLERPDDLEQLAFADIDTLGAYLRGGLVSCVELTEMYLGRLERIDAELHCVISFTRARALAQARALDGELARGEDRGPLHGIPWGAKDLFAVKGTRTTWGAKPYEEQVIDVDATVVERLDQAGAVLIAKLSLGALAMGDVWFGERTRSPWNPEAGSSGSSAGSAAATAAGGVAFALGTETLGSIISPSVRCGNSALRPTFGRVSRYGAMALSWSMDKVGPICRSLQDAAIVLQAIQGPDGRDPSVHDFPFERRRGVLAPKAQGSRTIRIGYDESWFERSESLRPVLAELEQLGFELVPFELPQHPAGDLLSSHPRSTEAVPHEHKA